MSIANHAADALDEVIAALRAHSVSFRRSVAEERLDDADVRIERLRVRGSSIELGFAGGRYVFRCDDGGEPRRRRDADLGEDVAAAQVEATATVKATVRATAKATAATCLDEIDLDAPEKSE